MSPPRSRGNPSKIFISYRSSESAGHAGRLYDQLRAHFGTQAVVIDIESIEPGEDFVEAIEDAVSSCKILLAVIGQQWLTSANEHERRLDDPKDFVRLEIATALKQGIRVIPVLVQGATMPREQDLPDDIAPLARRQAWEVSDRRWNQDVGKLIEKIERDIHRRDLAPSVGSTPATHGAPLGSDAGSGRQAGGSGVTQTITEKQPEVRQPPAAIGTWLRYSTRAAQVIALADQFRQQLGKQNIHRAMLLASLVAHRADSLAHAFLSRLGLEQAELFRRLARTYGLKRPLQPDFNSVTEAATAKLVFPFDAGVGPPLAFDLSENAREALVLAQITAHQQGASEVTPQHLFAALCVMTAKDDPGWLEWEIGTKNLNWIRETLEQAGSKTLTEDDVLLAALKAGLYAAPTAFHDGTAENDSLEFGEYADALVNIILKPQTVPPLVVGIYGPWGSGKSTFMRLVRDRLIERTAPPAQSRLKTYVVSRFVRAKSLFRRTDAAPKLAPTPRLIPINYDAWAYADATKLWTGLIERIARELDAELGWWGRFKYLCDSNLRKLLAAFLLGLLPVCWLALRLLTAKLGTIDARDHLAAWSLGWLGTQFHGSDYVSGALALIGAGCTYLLQRRPVSNNVSALAARFDSAPAAGVIHSIQDEFKTALRAKISPPQKKKTEEQRRQEIALGVRQNKLKIVIFIDELDRCPLERIVDILEAIKLFLAEDIFIVLLGVDTRVASEAIRLHYKAVRNPDLPREYLEKIVQLPLRIPTAKRTELEKYLKDLMPTAAQRERADVGRTQTKVQGQILAPTLGAEASATEQPQAVGMHTVGPRQSIEVQVGGDAQSQQQTEHQNAGAKGRTAPGTNAERHVEPVALPASKPLWLTEPRSPTQQTRREASGTYTLAQLPDTDTEFNRMAELGERFLESNPRRIKRLLNTYRYVKVLASHPKRNEPIQTKEWQETMLAWLAFTMRWPAFMARALEEVEREELRGDTAAGYLLRVPADSPSAVEAPSAKDIQSYLPVSARQLVMLYNLAGNFLVENPLASTPSPNDEQAEGPLPAHADGNDQ